MDGQARFAAGVERGTRRTIDGYCQAHLTGHQTATYRAGDSGTLGVAAAPRVGMRDHLPDNGWKKRLPPQRDTASGICLISTAFANNYLHSCGHYTTALRAPAFAAETAYTGATEPATGPRGILSRRTNCAFISA